MSNSTFDALRFVAEIILPACGALYAALAGIWGWPYAEAIVGTIAAVDTFLGAIVIGLRKNYNKKGETHEEDLLESEQSDGE